MLVDGDAIGMLSLVLMWLGLIGVFAHNMIVYRKISYEFVACLLAVLLLSALIVGKLTGVLY